MGIDDMEPFDFRCLNCSFLFHEHLLESHALPESLVSHKCLKKLKSAGESVGMPCVIPPSRSNLDVGQIWEVGGVLMGLTSPNSPVIVGQEFSASAASRSDSFSCWLWMSTQQWPVSFHYYSLVLVSVVSGRASNKHASAITKRNRYVSHCVVIIIQWAADGSLPRAFDHCPSVELV